MAKASSKEKNKKIILAVLLLLAVVIAVWNFTRGPEPRRPANRPDVRAGAQPAPRPAVSGQPRPAPAANQQEALYQQMLADASPLNFSLISNRGEAAKVGPRGNIFAFYVPPPQPTPTPPPPPPIALQMVQPQSAVAGTPRDIVLTVTGQGFPQDAQILMDGRPKTTRRMNETTVATDVSAAEYSGPRNATIEVKSQADPVKLYSNPIPFIVQAAPEPPFRYIGRIGENGLFEMGGTKEHTRKKRGEVIQGVWRIDSITDQAVEVTNTTYEIKKRIPMVEKVR
ncbi:MAG TPA: hypothetical protein VNH22_00010 [Blastocatellia bacterium]|jgi:hypothetical protein|nr:hypothetical protein [Blastocatellia bacterium]